jgi:hypothetical protein
MGRKKIPKLKKPSKAELKRLKTKGVTWSDTHSMWKASYANLKQGIAYKSKFCRSYDDAVKWRNKQELCDGLPKVGRTKGVKIFTKIKRRTKEDIAEAKANRDKFLKDRQKEMHDEQD